jgi:hypothetical protein
VDAPEVARKGSAVSHHIQGERRPDGRWEAQRKRPRWRHETRDGRWEAQGERREAGDRRDETRGGRHRTGELR